MFGEEQPGRYLESAMVRSFWRSWPLMPVFTLPQYYQACRTQEGALNRCLADKLVCLLGTSLPVTPSSERQLAFLPFSQLPGPEEGYPRVARGRGPCA
jgi:hypothetical protein